MPKRKTQAERVGDTLRRYALEYPGATEHFPWGEVAIKVRGKVFLFLHAQDEKVSLSTKLPRTRKSALALPFAKPTGYGLGKSGWVSAAFDDAKSAPVDLLKEWIDESYRAIAPKKLVAELDAHSPGA